MGLRPTILTRSFYGFCEHTHTQTKLKMLVSLTLVLLNFPSSMARHYKGVHKGVKCGKEDRPDQAKSLKQLGIISARKIQLFKQNSQDWFGFSELRLKVNIEDYTIDSE